MVVDGRVIYDENEGSYGVLSNSVVDEALFGKNTFICHLEGNPKVIYRLFKQHSNEIQGDLLFCYQDKNFFSNHSEEIAPGLWKYTGDIFYKEDT